MLNSAVHEICPVKKNQIANNSKFFFLNISEHENFFANKYERGQNTASKDSLCSAELSMKKGL